MTGLSDTKNNKAIIIQVGIHVDIILFLLMVAMNSSLSLLRTYNIHEHVLTEYVT